VVACPGLRGLGFRHAVHEGLHCFLGRACAVAALEELQQLAAGGDVLDQAVTVLQERNEAVSTKRTLLRQMRTETESVSKQCAALRFGWERDSYVAEAKQMRR
jgi:hypothetical protein